MRAHYWGNESSLEAASLEQETATATTEQSQIQTQTNLLVSNSVILVYLEVSLYADCIHILISIFPRTLHTRASLVVKTSSGRFWFLYRNVSCLV